MLGTWWALRKCEPSLQSKEICDGKFPVNGGHVGSLGGSAGPSGAWWVFWGLLGRHAPASGLVSAEIPGARHPQGPAAHAAAGRGPASHAAQGPLPPQVSPLHPARPTAGVSPSPLTVYCQILELPSCPPLCPWRSPTWPGGGSPIPPHCLCSLFQTQVQEMCFRKSLK